MQETVQQESLLFICPKCNKSFDKELKLKFHLLYFDHTRDRTCKCGCGEQVEPGRAAGGAGYKIGHRPPKVRKETRICPCGCNQTFECWVTSTQRFIDREHYLIYTKLRKESICPRCNRICLSERGLTTHLLFCQTGKVSKRKIPCEIRFCECGCGYQKSVPINDTWRFKAGHNPVWNKGKTVATEPRLKIKKRTFKSLICKGCGIQFVPNSSKQDFCLPTCWERYRKEHEESNGKRCIVCTKPLFGNRVKYCNETCKEIDLWETRICICGCKGEFRCLKKSKQDYIVGHGRKHSVRYNSSRWKKGHIPKNKGKTMLEVMGETRYVTYIEKSILNHDRIRHTDRFIRGKYFSKKNSNTLKFDSGWELVIFIKLENDAKILKYERCPFSLPYLFNGQQHRYFPDLLVQYIDSTSSIIEIKPDYELVDPQTMAKFDRVREYCKEKNLKFEVRLEKDTDIDPNIINLSDITFFKEDKKQSFIMRYKTGVWNVIERTNN